VFAENIFYSGKKMIAPAEGLFFPARKEGLPSKIRIL